MNQSITSYRMWIRGLPALLFMLCFIGRSLPLSASLIGSAVAVLTASFQEPDTQWIFFSSLLACFVSFQIIRCSALGQGRFVRACNPCLWLAALVTVLSVCYFRDYAGASHSLQALKLLGGLVLGTGIAIWTRKMDGPLFGGGQRMVVVALVCLLAGTAFWKSDHGTSFQYHGIQRWQGLWDNPNTYGLLMAVGFFLALGLAADGISGGVRKVLLFLCLFAAGLCAYGLYRSYSRGAWLGAAVGLAYLTSKLLAGCADSSLGRLHAGIVPLCRWCRSNVLSLVVIMASLAGGLFLQCQDTRLLPARRVFSAGNLNDFSWRNRVMAWKGELRMMAARPWGGFGWGHVEDAFEEQYSSKLAESPYLVRLNDYLLLGAAAGVPAVAAFIGYLIVSCGAGSTRSGQQGWGAPTPISLLTNRAATLVLLVGFWFDGGLFQIVTAMPFWFLWETSWVHPPANQRLAVTAPSLKQFMPPPNRGLGCLAISLAIAVLGLCGVHAFTPGMPVTADSLALAQTFLVSDRCAADFFVLASDPAWHGKPMRDLLNQAQLANYNRSLVKWQVDEKIYRKFVLSPKISPAFDGRFNWRRELWEYYYPQIRHALDIDSAARLVLQKLHQRVRVPTISPSTTNLLESWQHREASTYDLAALAVAVLRSVGVPARLADDGNPEYYNGLKWVSLRAGPG